MFEIAPNGTHLLKYIPDNREAHIIIPDGIRSIAANTFVNCQNLISVTFSSNCYVIEAEAFQNCPKLTKIIINHGFEDFCYTSGGTPFVNCPNLNSLELPATIKRVSLGNSDVYSVRIQEGAKELPVQIFTHSEKLESVYLPESIEIIKNGAFMGCSQLKEVHMPSNLKEIEFMAFFNCQNLRTLRIPNSVKSIGHSCFQGSGIEHITFPEGISVIGQDMFSMCKNLRSFVIPNSVTAIHQDAFYNTGIQSIRIPPNVHVVGKHTFYLCHLKEIILSNPNTKFVANPETIDSLDIPTSVRIRGEGFRVPGRWNEKKIWVTMIVLWLIYCLLSIFFDPSLLYCLLFVCAYFYFKKEYHLGSGVIRNIKYIYEELFARKWYERVPTV